MKVLNFNSNPILVKELRSRMRGWRAFATLTGYLIFLALFSYGIYRIILSATPYTGGLPLSPFIGQALYAAIANLSLFFVVFLTPALTAAAISSEHEKLTLEMLQATPLPAYTILWGKLISTAGYIFLLLFAAVPIVSLIFVFGGVALTDLLLAALVIWATAITFGMIGLFFSAWRKRTIQAIVLSYLVILIMIGGTYALYIFWGIVLQDFPPRFILVINPFSALASVLSLGGYQAGVSGVFSFLAGLGPAIIMGDPTLFQQARPLWHYTLAFDIGLSTALYLLATRFIKPIHPWRVDKRALLILVLIALLYIGLSLAVFHQDFVAFISPLPVPPTPTPALFFNAVPARVAPPIQPIVLPTTAPLPLLETPTEEATDGP